MRITRTFALAATAAVALGIGAIAPAASAAPSAGSEDTPTYQEFADSTYRDVDGGYVVNGDELVSTKGDLRSFYDSLHASAVKCPSYGHVYRANLRNATCN